MFEDLSGVGVRRPSAGPCLHQAFDQCLGAEKFSWNYWGVRILSLCRCYKHETPDRSALKCFL